MASFTFLNEFTMDAPSIIFIVLLVVMIVALLVIPMFTNKKRAKHAEEQYRSIRPGTRVKTVGGIIGTVLEIRQVSPQDREMIIETGEGDNKTTMTFDIMALYQILSPAPADESENAANPAEANDGDVFASENAVENNSIAAEENGEQPAKEQAEDNAATGGNLFASQLFAEEKPSSDETAAANEQSAPETSEQPVAEEEQVAAQDEQPAEESKPAAKKSAKKPAAKKPIAKNK